MATSDASPTLTLIREALRAAVDARSLRHVSRQVGISPAGLRKFMEGSRPYGATRRHVERWYVLHGPGRDRAALNGFTAFTVLRVMARNASPGRFRVALDGLVRTLGDAYRTAHLPEPAWLAEVRERAERLPRSTRGTAIEPPDG